MGHFADQGAIWKASGGAGFPRLPLEGALDLTYRCNNRCRHCWISPPSGPLADAEELTTDEWHHLVDEARRMGCRQWYFSGGEPLLRPDFWDIFDYATRRCAGYILNTNGTLITPALAGKLRRNGSLFVALYGATAAVHDHITRSPGSFERTMAGFRYLREAGTPFTVQVIPLRDNFHEYRRMLGLAESLSPHVRIGAAWLYLSASGNPSRNEEIRAQRLPPESVAELDPPDVTWSDDRAAHEPLCGGPRSADDGDRVFAGCMRHNQSFHVDPYGRMAFCVFIQDPALRYDLRQGSFEQGWERFLPEAAGRIRGGAEYLAHCGACALRSDCRWCPVYGYLEHRRYGAPVEYLCRAARDAKARREEWAQRHRRRFQIAGMTWQVDSDMPFEPHTLSEKFQLFETDTVADDLIVLRHHFALPPLERFSLGEALYARPPWRIYRKGGAWIYICDDLNNSASPYQVAVFSHDYRRARIYHRDDQRFRQGHIAALTLFSTDQILLAPLLAERGGCLLHASGVILHGRAALFVGHSEAGKSTMMRMTSERAEWLTDDRMIVRRWPDGFRAHGCWSHGEIPQVSPKSAPLGGLIFLRHADGNRLIRLVEPADIMRRLLPCVIKPLMTANWWDRTLRLAEQLLRETPFYVLEYDLSGAAVGLLEAEWRRHAQSGISS